MTHADSDSTSSSDDDCAISTRTLSTSRKNEIKFTEEIVALKNKNRALKVENLKLKEENQDMKIASAKGLDLFFFQKCKNNNIRFLLKII